MSLGREVTVVTCGRNSSVLGVLTRGVRKLTARLLGIQRCWRCRKALGKCPFIHPCIHHFISVLLIYDNQSYTRCVLDAKKRAICSLCSTEHIHLWREANIYIYMYMCIYAHTYMWISKHVR